MSELKDFRAGAGPRGTAIGQPRHGRVQGPRGGGIERVRRSLRPTAPFKLAVLLAAAFLASSCTLSHRRVSDPAASVARLRSGGDIREEVDLLAQPLVKSGEVHGMVVGLMTPDGVVRTYGYGRTGRPSDTEPPGADAIFQVGSITKVFVVSLLAILVDEGKLSYEDTVRSILPEDVPIRADVGQLTLYELAAQSGGLPRQPADFPQFRHLMVYLFTGRNLYGHINREYLYEYLRVYHLKPEGKRGYTYSNIGVALLAHLIEIKTGRSVPDLIDEKICRPLEMRDTVFVLNAEQQTRLAVGHVGDQPKFVRRNTPMAPWDMGEIMRASGGLYSTVNDLMVFARSNLGLSHNSLDPILATTHRVQIRTPAEDMAFVWAVNYFDSGRLAVTYVHGMVSGYSAYMGMDTDHGIAVIVLSNSFNWDDKVGHNLAIRLSEAFASDSCGAPVNRARLAAQCTFRQGEGQ